MVKRSAEKVKAGELVIDMDLYPRQKINRFHVNRLVEALKSGEELPPVHADRKTKIVSDGNHRVEAYFKHGGAAAGISVIWHDYKNKAEMFDDAILLNSSHGMAFSVFDLGRILIKSEEYVIKVERICRMLHISMHKAQKILNRIKEVTVTSEKTEEQSGEETEEQPKKVYVKRGLNKLHTQETITEDQAEINEHALGVAPLRLANDLLDKIEGNCLLYTADFLFVLEKLRGAIDVVLEAHRVEEVSHG